MPEYSNTSLKLNIISLQEDFGRDKGRWVGELEEEYEDLREEGEEEYEREMGKYRALMKAWVEERRAAKDEHGRDRAEKPYSAGWSKIQIKLPRSWIIDTGS